MSFMNMLNKKGPKLEPCVISFYSIIQKLLSFDILIL